MTEPKQVAAAVQVPARLPDGARVVRGERPIEGVQVIPLRRIPDERGTIFHMLRESDAHFERFGEIYFSTVYKGVIKGWHQHKDMSLNYACMVGRVKCALFDDREGSASKGSLMEVFLGPDSYSLLIVPPGRVERLQGPRRPALGRRQLLHARARPEAQRAARPVRERHRLRLGRQAPLTCASS